MSVGLQNSDGRYRSTGHNRRVVYLIVGAVVAFVVWAANAPLEEVVRGEGRVVPMTKAQIIQNLEGGIVEEIFVFEGDVVEAGQRVAKMNDTQFLSGYKELTEQRLALLLKLDRLQTEKNFSGSFEPDSEISQNAPELASSELDLFKARKSDLVSTIKLLEQAAKLKRQEVDILKPMVEKNAVAEIDLVRVEQAAVEAEGKILAALNEFETLRSQEYSDALIQLRQAEQQIRIRKDQLARTDVLSPVYGIINKVSATTIGGVVGPGDPLMEIIPLDEQLRVEGRVDPKDIGFVYVGMPASIKLTAFDFSIFGVLNGTVVHVGADTVVDQQSRDSLPYYEVFVKVDETTLEGPDGSVAIRPGMLAQVELQSGKKTVLEYLLKPLFKTTEAFSER